MAVRDTLVLLDWKRRVFDLYAEVRRAETPRAGWDRWAAERRALFATHDASPVPPDRRASYDGPHLFDYDPALRVLGEVEDAPAAMYAVTASAGDPVRFTRVGAVRFAVNGAPQRLELLWLDAYGGGLFLPFRDATAGVETYGAGRYLLDTVKGADLGTQGGLLVLDFNFAYNPSCSYDPRWACPLAPPPNRLDVAVRAGERHGGTGGSGPPS